MAIITSGTPIKKVLSGGTPIQKVLSQGTVIWTSAITISIPKITGVAIQELKVGGTTVYSGAGGVGVTVTVQSGSSVALSATAATGYNVYVTTPVTANSNFSTASYITAAIKTFTVSYPAKPAGASFIIIHNSVVIIESSFFGGSFTVNYGDIVELRATPETGYEFPTVSPSGATEITNDTEIIVTAGRRFWTFSQTFAPLQAGAVSTVDMTGLLVGTSEKPVYIEWTLDTNTRYASGSGSITSSSGSITADTGSPAIGRTIVIITAENNTLKLTLNTLHSTVTEVTVGHRVYQ